MTEKEFDKLRFTMLCYLSMKHKHAATYQSVDFYPSICICRHAKAKKDGTFDKSYTNYRFKGKVYGSKHEVINAINAHFNNLKQRTNEKRTSNRTNRRG